MKNLFISQPMKGLSEEEIKNARAEAINDAYAKYGKVHVIDSYYFSDEDFKNVKTNTLPLYYLGKSIELLSSADLVYFIDGWKNARGCKIEHECAKEYGLQIIHD